MSYNFDFWDKNKNLFRAALGQVQANIAEEAFAKLTLGISLAKVYFDLQMDYRKYEVAQAVVNNRKYYYELIQGRIKANLDNNIALSIASSGLADANVAQQKAQSNLQIHEYQLKAYLAGNFQEEIKDLKILENPISKIPLPADLPLHLISRRPDIISLLWLIESAGRQIEVAKAGFYPDFNLSGFLDIKPYTFANSSNGLAAFLISDPAVTLPIFDGGRLTANLRASEVNYDIAILNYNDKVINAASEVMQSISVVKSLHRQLQDQKQKAQAQKDQYSLTKMRMEHKLNSQLDVLTSEMNYLVSYSEEIDTLDSLIQAVLTLIQSLGGGYEACYEE